MLRAQVAASGTAVGKMAADQRTRRVNRAAIWRGCHERTRQRGIGFRLENRPGLSRHVPYASARRPRIQMQAAAIVDTAESAFAAVVFHRFVIHRLHRLKTKARTRCNQVEIW